MDTFHFSMLFSMVVTLVIADYECLCNYAIQLAIQSEPNSTATAIGQIYEFDCKPTYRLAPNTPNWFAVQYEHKVSQYYLAGNRRNSNHLGFEYRRRDDIICIPSDRAQFCLVRGDPNYTVHLPSN